MICKRAKRGKHDHLPASTIVLPVCIALVYVAFSAYLIFLNNLISRRLPSDREMGLPMDPNLSTIHVPSGPTSLHAPSVDLSTLTLQQLISRKDNLEAELKALGAVLDTHGVTMQSSLTTFDGYPRSDIDVAQVRVTRARIINLRNDWKEVMARIEKGLHEHHAKIQAQPQVEEPAQQPTQPATQSQAQPQPEVPATPFARVNSVEHGSPAHEAGLKTGDLIRRFGAADWTNHERLRKVGEEVQRNLGRPILVKLLRGDRDVEVRVTPRNGWGGRGSLGCHVVPV